MLPAQGLYMSSLVLMHCFHLLHVVVIFTSIALQYSDAGAFAYFCLIDSWVVSSVLEVILLEAWNG